jgi:hypothetical protein
VVTFLFWNTRGNAVASRVARLAEGHRADVLILAECRIPPAQLLGALNQGPPARQFTRATGGAKGIALYTRFSRHFTTHRETSQNGRLHVWGLALPARHELLLVTAHLPSPLHMSRAGRQQMCARAARTMRNHEEQVGHRRTLVVGDLNVDPFDSGVLGAEGFHAVMTRERAARSHRTIQGTRCSLMYSPMWGCFGDVSPGPPGTYHYANSEPVCQFWHVYDQVLVGADLLSCFDARRLAVLDSDGRERLVTRRGLPNARSASDHLPIVFGLAI